MHISAETNPPTLTKFSAGWHLSATLWQLGDPYRHSVTLDFPVLPVLASAALALTYTYGIPFPDPFCENGARP